jgi:hypothetical protein
MNLGAGNFTTGGYWDERKGVLCNVNESKENKDSSVVRCVLKWYLNNPIKTASLFYHKSIYFWSPWIGPNAEGTTGRNPWLRYGPLEVLNDKESSIQIIQGSFGKFISALWQIFSLFFLFYGLINIYKLRNLERQIGVMSMILILVNWGICLLTIGDHRFRLPILGISVFLQIAGLQFLLRRKLKDKGYWGIHFFDEVVNDGRQEQLTKDIAAAMKKDIEIIIKTNRYGDNNT